MRAAVLLCLGLAACAPDLPVPPAEISGPTPALMIPPAPLKDIPRGAGLKEVTTDSIQCRKAYGRETDKLRLLQTHQTVRRG